MDGQPGPLRANILGSARDIGVGAAASSSPYYTQNFGDYSYQPIAQPPRGGCPGSVPVGALRAPHAKLVTTTRRATTIASLSALSLSPRRFRTGGRGTLVSYVLSGSALVSFGAERGLSSRSVGGRCRAPTRSNRRAKPCVRYRTLAGTFTDEGEAGRNTFRFIGHLGGSKLKPGRYRLRGVATLASASDRLRPATQGRFEIVRR